MATNSYSNLKSAKSAWNKALRNFGIVTVMNAKVYDVYDGIDLATFKGYVKGDSGDLSSDQIAVLKKINAKWFNGDTIKSEAKIDFKELKANEIIALYLMTNPIAELKYLKTANSTQEGPTKTITGGQNASPLIKYGKTARLEMQDALGNAEALEALSGLTVEYFRTTYADTVDRIENDNASDVLHATTLFAGHKTIVGDTFMIDAKTGAQVPAYAIFYDFLPDSLLNLNQDAEGDATVFDMNGDLVETRILIGDLTNAKIANNYKKVVTKYDKDPRKFVDASKVSIETTFPSTLGEGEEVGKKSYSPAAIQTDESVQVTETEISRRVISGQGGDKDGIVTGTFYTILPNLEYDKDPQVIEDDDDSE